MKNQNLTLVDKELLIVLIKSGMTPEEARNFVLGITDTETKPTNKVSSQKVVSSYSKKDTKSKDLDSKSKSRKSKRTVATKKSNEDSKTLKVGDYVKVNNLKDKSVVNFGKITKAKKDSVYLNGAKNTHYSLKNCVKISKKDFGKMKKSSTASKKISTTVNTKKLDTWYYALALAYVVDSIDKDLEMVKQVNATALNDKNRLSDLIKNMRERNLVEKGFGADKARKVLAENKIEIKETAESRFDA